MTGTLHSRWRGDEARRYVQSLYSREHQPSVVIRVRWSAGPSSAASEQRQSSVGLLQSPTHACSSAPLNRPAARWPRSLRLGCNIRALASITAAAIADARSEQASERTRRRACKHTHLAIRPNADSRPRVATTSTLEFPLLSLVARLALRRTLDSTTRPVAAVHDKSACPGSRTARQQAVSLLRFSLAERAARVLRPATGKPQAGLAQGSQGSPRRTLRRARKLDGIQRKDTYLLSKHRRAGARTTAHTLHPPRAAVAMADGCSKCFAFFSSLSPSSCCSYYLPPAARGDICGSSCEKRLLSPAHDSVHGSRHLGHTRSNSP